ncbi:MAG: glycosyltransferase [Lachnospiraceae bacterium]|nr:glycosyltransferase [Lachnospiraceae bacterium]
MFEISVIIPTYNREKSIENSIRSVLDQNSGEFSIAEVLIIDDNSADDTEMAVKTIPDERIKYHRNSENLGAGGARNRGVELAASEWIAFQDSDDVWAADKLKKQCSYLAAHPECEMMTHAIKAHFPDKEIVTVIEEQEDMFGKIAAHNFVDAPSILMKKSVFEELGGFDTSLKALEDWDLALRYLDGHKIGVINEPLLDADMTIGGVSSDAGNHFDAGCRIIAKNLEMLKRHGCFESAVQSLLMQAAEKNVLGNVSKLLEYHITHR